jgi:hypothetical protein
LIQINRTHNRCILSINYDELIIPLNRIENKIID